MLLPKGDVRDLSQVTPSAELISDMLDFVGELKQAGALISYDGLDPTATAARVHVNKSGEQRVVEGPFTPDHEQVSGFFLISAASLEDAVGWAKKMPLAAAPPTTAPEFVVEVRRITDAQADLPAMTQEDHVRDLQHRRDLPVA